MRHAQFGEGKVQSVELSGDPRVVAFFPGRGEKKVLLRFLEVL